MQSGEHDDLDQGSTVTLDVWSDVVCAWCYVAKYRIRKAIDGWSRPADVRLVHRAFERDPHRPRGENAPVLDDLARRYDVDAAEAGAIARRLSDAAAEEGILLDLDRAVTANTFDAHRLVALARDMGGLELAQAALERFRAAHFAEGLPLDDHLVLQRITAEAGMDERWVASVLDGDDYAESVRDDEADAALRGVEQVPYVLANGRQPLVGAQPVEIYRQTLDAVGG